MADPTFALEMNLSADLLGYFQIGVGQIGVDKIGGAYAVGQWTSLQTRLQAFTAQRGQEDELSGLSPGTMTAVLDDDDSALDPSNSGSVYYPNVKLARQARLLATYNGLTYGLGTGFVDEYAATPLPLGADVTVRATDLFARLARRNLKGVSFAQARVDQRLNALLDLIQWPAQQRAIDTSTLTVPAVSFTSDTYALTHIASLALADASTFYVRGDGYVAYLFRHRHLTSSSIGTFGAGGTLVNSVASAFNDQGLYTQVRVKRTSGTEQVANDVSQAVYDVRSYSLSQDAADQLPTDTDANAWANWVLAMRTSPVQHVTSIVLDPAVAPDTLWPLVLGSDIGQRVTVTHNVPGTKGVTGQDYEITSVNHSWNPLSSPQYLCTWGLKLAQVSSGWMIIGTGEIGVSKLAY